MTDDEIAQLITVEHGELGFHEEDGPNKGTCEKYQKATGGVPGDSWCMDFQEWALIQVLSRCPLRLSGSCEEVREDAIAKGWITDTPSTGCLFLLIDPVKNHAHHTGLITGDPDDTGYPTLEGNTNNTGSSNGDSVCVHHRGSGSDTNTYEYIDLRKAV